MLVSCELSIRDQTGTKKPSSHHTLAHDSIRQSSSQTIQASPSVEKNMDNTMIESYEFESLKLQVGGRVQCISHRKIKPIQLFSTLIGYAKDEYIIIKTPIENGALAVVQVGDKLTIRVFSGVSVCWFSCKVLRIFSLPLNYMHLSFTVSIQGTRLRATMRVKVDITAQLAMPGLEPVPVSLINLSTSGTLLESATPLPANYATVNLSFTLNQPDGKPPTNIDTSATIQNTNEDKITASGQAETFIYGLQFVDLDPIHCVMLQNMAYEAFIEDRARIV